LDGNAALVWLGVALVLGVVETVTVDFTFLMLAGGALGGSAAAALGAPITVQVIVAAVTAVLGGIPTAAPGCPHPPRE